MEGMKNAVFTPPEKNFPCGAIFQVFALLARGEPPALRAFSKVEVRGRGFLKNVLPEQY
jgi:hypothetical protein